MTLTTVSTTVLYCDLGHKQTDACRVSVETGNGNDVDSVTQPELVQLEYCQVKLEGLNKSLPALKDWCANKFNSPGLDQRLGRTDPGCYFSERCCGITSQS